MSLYELSKDLIGRLPNVDFKELKIFERGDLQRLLRDHVDVIAPDTLVISEEFSGWDRIDRRIDLLGVDRQGRLVVIELKRTSDDAFADLQALRYAAMVSKMTFEEAVETFKAYLTRREMEGDARSKLLEFLGWGDALDGRFGEDVRIILAAAGFSQEVTSTVLWLNERDLDIVCVKIQPYRLGESVLLDVQQIIPLPEASEYQVQIRQKQREARVAAGQGADWTRYDVNVDGSVKKGCYKRQVVLEAVRQLVKKGKSPSEIEGASGVRLFEVVEGSVSGASFAEEIRKKRPNDTRAPERYFLQDEQLFRSGGRTYALTTQWSKAKMEPTLEAFKGSFGDFGFTYEETKSD